MGEENEKIEFKTSTAELQSALDSIVAILNKHQKGILYFGVKNDGTPVGQIIGANTLRDVSRAITDHIEPKIFPIVEKVMLNGKECIKVEFEGNNIPYFANGRAFIRVSDEDKKISQKELKNMILQTERKNNKWEEEPSNITIDDIDEETLKKFIEKGNKKVDDKVDDKIKLTMNQQKIIKLILENPYIVREEISQKVGISITSVSNNLKKLTEKGIIKRLGANKNGYWQILKK